MYRKELAYYFSSPIAYIVIGLYLLAISLFLWVIPGEWNIIDSGYSQVDGLFRLSPWLMMLLCPALSMRLFAEERQSGTWNLLMTKPIALWRIVVCKYLAAWTLVIIGILPCLVHYFVVYFIAEPIGNIDFGQFLGSWLGLILLSAAFMGIGVLAGSTTKSQIVAFILGALACFVLYWVSLQDHYSSISRGVIDLRDVIIFLSIAVVAILLTIMLLDKLTHR
ncbi:MAG: ABC-2 transporter permease [Paludibacteraceae bacterium]|nr:ABC-2 transporter permease [Paludibacteraceae bacterium]